MLAEQDCKPPQVALDVVQRSTAGADIRTGRGLLVDLGSVVLIVGGLVERDGWVEGERPVKEVADHDNKRVTDNQNDVKG